MVKTTNENSFKEFLWQHVDLALTKGFDDNVGKNPVPAIFEVMIFYYNIMILARIWERLEGFIDFWVSKVWYKVHITNEINPIYLQILLF